MFNAIEDALVVVLGQTKLKFMNVYAKELIQQEDESLDQPFLYLFSDADGDDL